jgi:hypothetical protein
LPQRIVNSRLPSATGGSEIGNDIGIEPDVAGFFGRFFFSLRTRRSGLAEQAVACTQLRLLEPVAVEMLGFIRIDPAIRPALSG